MVDRYRDAFEAWLRERVNDGAVCPFCASNFLRAISSLVIHEPPKPKPESWMRDPSPENPPRARCEDCGYILLFKDPILGISENVTHRKLGFREVESSRLEGHLRSYKHGEKKWSVGLNSE